MNNLFGIKQSFHILIINTFVKAVYDAFCRTRIAAYVFTLNHKFYAVAGNVKMLTSCPACQQGLSRYADDTGLETDYIVVELANRLLGNQWQKDFIERVKNGGVERVLL